MLRLRSYIRKYFGFSRKETNGFLILIPLTALVILFPSLLKYHLRQFKTNSNDNQFTQAMADEIRANILKKDSSKLAISKPSFFLRPAPFDPNKTSKEQLQRMGLSKKLAQTISNYREKGGVFRVKSDFLKIYGVNQQIFNELRDYIELPEKLTSGSGSRRTSKNENYKSSKSSEIIPKNLNLASREDFQSISGIGEVLSQRIVSFRTGLGGFHSLEQLEEIYALDDSVVLRLKKHFYLGDSINIKQLDLVNSTEQEFSRHPYINSKLAKIIVAYRQHHPFQSISQLKEIKIISDSTYQKLAPYLNISDMN